MHSTLLALQALVFIVVHCLCLGYLWEPEGKIGEPEKELPWTLQVVIL